MLLLDTHAAVWRVAMSHRLPPKIVAMIETPGAKVLVSMVSIWEISFKHALARGDRPPFSGSEAWRYFERASFKMLSITREHLMMVEQLPPHHGDPFDRLIVAQALAEPLRLITHDTRLAAYSDTIITF